MTNGRKLEMNEWEWSKLEPMSSRGWTKSRQFRLSHHVGFIPAERSTILPADFHTEHSVKYITSSSAELPSWQWLLSWQDDFNKRDLSRPESPACSSRRVFTPQMSRVWATRARRLSHTKRIGRCRLTGFCQLFSSFLLCFTSQASFTHTSDSSVWSESTTCSLRRSTLKLL